MQTYVAQETVVVQPAGEQAIVADAFLVERTFIIGNAYRQTHVIAAGIAFVAIVAVSAGHRY